LHFLSLPLSLTLTLSSPSLFHFSPILTHFLLIFCASGSSSSGGGIEGDSSEVEKEGEAEEGETSREGPSSAERSGKDNHSRRKEVNGMDHVMADAGTMVKCEKSMEHDRKRRRDINGKKRGKNRR
jgi:hypothetical protein